MDSKKLLQYGLSILLSLALFAPHIPLFFKQLNLKGLGWIGPPQPWFFKYYMYYVFNFSPYVNGTLLFFVLQGIYISFKRKQFSQHKYRAIAFLWFALPAGIGYFYSVYRAPVLQSSVLIFGFPFLILFICSFIKLPVGWLKTMQIAALLLVLTTSLVSERNYYTLFYHQQTEMYARIISGYQKAYGKNTVQAFAQTEAAYLNFYKTKYNTGFTFQTFDSAGTNIAWRHWLQKSDAEYLVLCNPPIEWGFQYLAIAREYFPCPDSTYYGFNTDIFILKKDTVFCKSALAPLFLYQNTDTIKSVIPPSKDKNGVYHFHKTTGWRLFQSSNKPSWLNEKVRLDVSVEVYVDSVIPKGTLTLQVISQTGHLLDRRQSFMQNFIDTGAGWHTVYLTTRLYHSLPAAAKSKPAFVSVDFDYDTLPVFKFRNFKFEAVADNPVLYSLINK